MDACAIPDRDIILFRLHLHTGMQGHDWHECFLVGTNNTDRRPDPDRRMVIHVIHKNARMTINDKYKRWVELTEEMGDLGYALRLLDWDAKVMMPPEGILTRSRTHKFLAGIYHEKSIAPEYCELIEELNEDPGLSDLEKRNVRAVYRFHKRRVNMPTSFVKESAALYAEAYQAWLGAKKEKDASTFLPFLERIVENKKKEVELAGYEGHPYEYYTSYFEPGLTLQEIDQLFKSFEEQVLPFLKTLPIDKHLPTDAFSKDFPVDDQMAYCQQLISEMGFDKLRGRLDVSEHPFTNGMTRHDVRITTRVHSNQLEFSVWSTLHELGHAIYEQNLPGDAYGLPGSLAASFGVHESQARFWENHIGRSRAFWEVRYDQFRELFPAFKSVDLDTFYATINHVSPNLIRTEADEIHYHFHVMIRYQLEKELLDGTVKVADLPAAWNERYDKYLGISAKNDAEGMLQDMHWSQGQWGYFPSYSIGSFMAAQLASAVQKDIPNFEREIGEGNSRDIISWMKKHIYDHGRTRLLNELLTEATGEPLNIRFFSDYARQKYSTIYKLNANIR